MDIIKCKEIFGDLATYSECRDIVQGIRKIEGFKSEMMEFAETMDKVVRRCESDECLRMVEDELNKYNPFG